MIHDSGMKHEKQSKIVGKMKQHKFYVGIKTRLNEYNESLIVSQRMHCYMKTSLRDALRRFESVTNLVISKTSMTENNKT